MFAKDFHSFPILLVGLGYQLLWLKFRFVKVVEKGKVGVVPDAFFPVRVIFPSDYIIHVLGILVSASVQVAVHLLKIATVTITGEPTVLGRAVQRNVLCARIYLVSIWYVVQEVLGIKMFHPFLAWDFLNKWPRCLHFHLLGVDKFNARSLCLARPKIEAYRYTQIVGFINNSLRRVVILAHFLSNIFGYA